MKIRTDCRHFPGDRPCKYHKQGLASCGDCTVCEPRGSRVLIVKLEALGDVLRTTSVLPALKRAYGNCYVTWVTSAGAKDLFAGNPLVDEVLIYPDNCLPALLTRRFDVAINPDASPRSSEIAGLVRAEKRYGFVVGESGEVIALNAAAEEWLMMGGSDSAKQNNHKTYQQILHEMCEVNSEGQRIIVGLTEEEAARRSALAASLGIEPGHVILGINTGAGSRWALKKWTVEGFIEVISSVLDSTEADVILLGGEAEKERNCLVRSHFVRRVSNPTINNLRELVQVVDLCNVVLTGDTLALHVAAGLGKRVVALFGPTSHREIDLYGRGTKVVPEIDCTCCYKRECSRSPNCMELIPAEVVLEAITREFGALEGEQQDEVSEISCATYEMVGEPGR